jgi:hypothetical protein
MEGYCSLKCVSQLLLRFKPAEFHILDVTRREHRPFFEPMTGSLGNHLIHRQPTTGFGE